MPVFAPPDILVLSGGGVLGEAWMTGVLAGIEDAAGADLRRTEAFVGTSAGSIVAASLAAGRSPRRPAEGAPAAAPARSSGDDDGSVNGGPGLRGALRTAGAAAWASTAPAASAALTLGAPGGALVRAAALARMPSGHRSLGDVRARVERWGAPGAEVADAVVASCSIPWVFEPVSIGGREYVDGGVWSVTNLDAAPAGRDTHVLCLDVLSGLDPGARGMTAMRRAFRVAAELETQSLRRRGAHVLRIGPDRGAADALGPDLMDPGPRDAALAAGFRQGAVLAGG